MPNLTQDAIQICVDRMDIMQLFAKYCHIVDDCEFQNLPDVFADDAHFDFSELGETVQGNPTIMDGVHKYGKFLSESMAHIGPGLTHFMTNHLIDVCGDEADVVTHNAVLNIPVGGYYKSHARRTADGWRIDRFKFMWRDYHAVAKKMGFDVSVLTPKKDSATA